MFRSSWQLHNATPNIPLYKNPFPTLLKISSVLLMLLLLLLSLLLPLLSDGRTRANLQYSALASESVLWW